MEDNTRRFDIVMLKSKISVIMLTYNREKYLERMIKCILAQTFSNYEFIIVDNGSTDQSGIIADSYAKKDSRIHVIHNKRSNIGSGRNAGLNAANGEYIAFVDDDDVCEPDFLEFLYNLIVENNADISICKAVKWEENNKSAYCDMPDKIFIMDAKAAIIELMWRKYYNNGFPSKLIKRKMFNQLSFPSVGRYDDIYLMYKVFANADKIVYYGLQKYGFVRHDNNNSIATTKHKLITAEYLDEYRNAYRERTKWLCKRFPEQSEYWWYFDWSFLISMVDKIVSNNLHNCSHHLNEMQQELMKYSEKFLSSSHILDFERSWMYKYVLS